MPLALRDLAADGDDDPTPCRDRNVRVAGAHLAETATAVFQASPQLLALAASAESDTATGAGTGRAAMARTLESPVFFSSFFPPSSNDALPSLVCEDDELSKAGVRESTVVMADTHARRDLELVRAAFAPTELFLTPASQPPPQLLAPVAHVQADLPQRAEPGSPYWSTMAVAIALGLTLAIAVGSAICWALISHGYVTLP